MLRDFATRGELTSEAPALRTIVELVQLQDHVNLCIKVHIKANSTSGFQHVLVEAKSSDEVVVTSHASRKDFGMHSHWSEAKTQPEQDCSSPCSQDWPFGSQHSRK